VTLPTYRRYINKCIYLSIYAFEALAKMRGINVIIIIIIIIYLQHLSAAVILLAGSMLGRRRDQKQAGKNVQR